MKRSTVVITATLLATLLLSACDISIRPAPEPPSLDATLQPGGADSPAWSRNLAAGANANFRIQVPGAGEGSVYYLELDEDLDLTLRRPNDFWDIVASSSSNEFYARGNLGITALEAQDLEAQAIGTATACRGSCIILPSGSATYYARVANTTGGSVPVNLYLYRANEQDDAEDNDSMATATRFDVAAATTDQGAIELLGDVDYWRIVGSGSVRFQPASGSQVDVRLTVLNENGRVIAGPVQAGTVDVINGDYLRVASASNRAGAPAVSRYTLIGQP